MRSPLDARPRLDAPGADAVLDAFTTMSSAGVPPGVAAARALLGHEVDWGPCREAVVTAGQAAVLATSGAGGPILAIRAFPSGAPTTVHDHGHAGAALVVEGRDRYERFRRSGPAAACLESIHDLAAGDVMWWGEPPDDLHRQTGLTGGAIELVLLAGPPAEPTTFTDVTPVASDLCTAVVDGLLAGEAARLAPWYAEDVLLDANVPTWRFQLRGRDAVLGELERQEFLVPDRRMTSLRVTGTETGLVVETELRFTDDGQLRVCRELHHLIVRGGLVVEHAAWCTGVADTAEVSSQFDTAPMERR